MRSWWNSLTSSNRHADSRKDPYNPSFTSIRTGLTSESVSSLTKHTGYSSYDISSPSSSQVNLSTAYTTQFPGLLRRDTGHGAPGMAMQDFHDGVAPPPPVADSWRRIDQWTEDNYPELYDQLSYGATRADIDELENNLELNLPADVRESFYIHDGQERGGRPTGLFFGIALLDCEELVDEYELWKKVAAALPRPDEYPRQPAHIGRSNPASRRASSQTIPNASKRPRPAQAKQGSRPEGAIQSVYSHPGWVPLAKDYMGNMIAIDLAPGSQGRVGQVILFGRDCDIKYVVSPSWASFLATFVDDLESDHVVVDEDVGVGGEMGQLRYIVDIDAPEQTFSYLDTLKARVRRRDRALRGQHPEAGSSTASLHSAQGPRKNGKGRAPSPLKQENFPRSSLSGMNGTIAAENKSSPKLSNGVSILRTAESDDKESNIDLIGDNPVVPHERASKEPATETAVNDESQVALDTTKVPEQEKSLKASTVDGIESPLGEVAAQQ